jgi:hypothetical protein
MLRAIFVKWPARILDGYFTTLRGFYLAAILILWPVIGIALLLYWGFGIRWGW